MLWFFALRTQAATRDEHQLADGTTLALSQRTPPPLLLDLRQVSLLAALLLSSGPRRRHPLDQELALGADCYSDLLRELVEYLGVGSTYAKVADCFARILGLELSTQAISDLVAEDAGDVEAFYVQQAPPTPTSEAALLVVQADGKGVPIVRATPAEAKVRLGKGDKHSRKKEAVVTGLYTIAPHPRTPAEVIASLFHPERPPGTPLMVRSGPQNKRLWATLAGKDAALARLAAQTAKREGLHIQHRVALTDGAEALQQRVQQHFPTFTLVLDFIHADEKLWDVANSLFGETAAQRTPWVERQSVDLLSGRVPPVITELRRLASLAETTATQRTVLTQVANYFERNTAYMHYDQYLAAGWPITSGVIKGACRHWSKTAANSRACAGPQLASKTYCVCGPSPKTVTGRPIAAFFNYSGSSVCTACQDPYRRYLKTKPWLIPHQRSRCANPQNTLSSCRHWSHAVQRSRRNWPPNRPN